MKILFTPRQPNLYDQWITFPIREDYQTIDTVLEDEAFVRQLAQDFPETYNGRHRTPVEQTLRFAFIKHHRGLSYRELEHTLNVNHEDRWFCKVSDKSPCFKTLQNQLSCISETSWQKINDLIIQKAREAGKTKGKKLRLDSTVAEANITYPTDANLLADGIRVIARIVKQLKLVPQKGYRTFTRTVKRLLYLKRTIGRKSKEIRAKATQELMIIAQHIVNHTKEAKDQALQDFRNITQQVINQTEQVLAGSKKIPDRIVSIFETYAHPIKKGKLGVSCEFGRLVQVQEDEAFITNWQIQEHPDDSGYLPEALQEHERIHNKSPDEAGFDRGYHSVDNDKLLKTKVKHYVLPQKGRASPNEKNFVTRKEKQLFNWRSGSEATISLGKRKYGLKKIRYRGFHNYAGGIAMGFVAQNLVRYAQIG
jgi:transposase, IS5 family